MHRRAVLLGLPLALPIALGACARSQVVWAPDADVSRYRYADPGPRSLSLITVKNEGTGNGAHSALLVNASERILFDPAGGWTNPSIPERHDVLYGLSPAALELYLSYQADDGYYYVKQEKHVPPEVAEAALVHAVSYGPVRQTLCTIACANILRALPGFESIRPALFPDTLLRRFAELPGVTTTERHGPDVVVEAPPPEPA